MQWKGPICDQFSHTTVLRVVLTIRTGLGSPPCTSPSSRVSMGGSIDRSDQENKDLRKIKCGCRSTRLLIHSRWTNWNRIINRVRLFFPHVNSNDYGQNSTRCTSNVRTKTASCRNEQPDDERTHTDETKRHIQFHYLKLNFIDHIQKIQCGIKLP
jgi:hypothetical protein